MRSVRLNTPDTWMSGVFYVTLLRTRAASLAPLCGYTLKAKGVTTFVTPFAYFTVLLTTTESSLVFF